jgi:hypothetical protein
VSAIQAAADGAHPEPDHDVERLVRLRAALLDIEWESRRARPNATLNRINDVARAALRESAASGLRAR